MQMVFFNLISGNYKSILHHLNITAKSMAVHDAIECRSSIMLNSQYLVLFFLIGPYSLLYEILAEEIEILINGYQNLENLK